LPPRGKKKVFNSLRGRRKRKERRPSQKEKKRGLPLPSERTILPKRNSTLPLTGKGELLREGDFVGPGKYFDSRPRKREGEISFPGKEADTERGP